MISSTASRLSAPRSSVKDAPGTTLSEVVARDALRDIVQTNKVTPRFAAFSFAHQVLRSLVSSFKIISPHILHGDINARNVLFMRKWKLCQLNGNGDGGHSWTHYKSRATADARARDLSAQGLLVEGPKVTIKAGLVDFGLSRQQNNWLWPRGYGPFEGLWTGTEGTRSAIAVEKSYALKSMMLRSGTPSIED